MGKSHIVIHRPETPVNQRHPYEQHAAGGKTATWHGVNLKVEHPPEGAPHVSHATVRQFLSATVNINKVATATPIAVATPQSVISSAVRSAALFQTADPHMQGAAVEEHARILVRAQVQKLSLSKARTQLLAGKRRFGTKDRVVGNQYLLGCLEDEDEDLFTARVTPSGSTGSSEDDGDAAPQTPDEWMERVLRELKDDDPRDLAELLRNVTQEDPYKLKAELSLIVKPSLSSEDNRKNTPKLMAWLRNKQELPSLTEVRSQLRDEARAELERLSETTEGKSALRELNTTEGAEAAAAGAGIKPADFLETYRQVTDTPDRTKPKDFCHMLKVAIERFGMDGLMQGIDLLMKALSQDLRMPMSSLMDKIRLHDVLTELGGLKINNTFVPSVTREVGRVEKAMKAYAASAAAAAA